MQRLTVGTMLAGLTGLLALTAAKAAEITKSDLPQAKLQAIEQAAPDQAPARLAIEVTEARLLCADRLRGQGKKDAARAIYKEVLATARPPHVRMAAAGGLVSVTAAEGSR